MELSCSITRLSCLSDAEFRAANLSLRLSLSLSVYCLWPRGWQLNSSGRTQRVWLAISDINGCAFCRERFISLTCSLMLPQTYFPLLICARSSWSWSWSYKHLHIIWYHTGIWTLVSWSSKAVYDTIEELSLFDVVSLCLKCLNSCKFLLSLLTNFNHQNCSKSNQLVAHF